MCPTPNASRELSPRRLEQLAQEIKCWGRELGFQQVGISDTDLSRAEEQLHDWLAAGYQGDMEWMARHGTKRTRPAELHADTRRIISARMDYRPGENISPDTLLNEPARAFISRYALGRDYHKLMRNRLQKLADRISDAIGPFGYRVFVDSAPVMEKPIAEKAGLGWIGKHTNLLHREAGSWFFLGEVYIDLPLPIDTPAENHCGICQRCIDVCPTQAIIAPYQLDARRCISYLTIELEGAIPLELRPLLGNRIYGCDDCQLFCPWNRFAKYTGETDFLPRHGLDTATLLELFEWDAATFLNKMEGSAIRRIGHEKWLRNIAVALGNGPAADEVRQALSNRLSHASPLVQEHVVWALQQLHK